MPANTDPNLGLHYGFAPRESGWGDSYNADLKKLGALIFLAVKSRTTTAQPATPAEGDRYIIPASATGTDWAGQDGNVALYQDAAWTFYPPAAGWQAFVADDANRVEYSTGNGWIVRTGISTADQTKLDYLSVTAATDLDLIRNRVASLDAALVLSGTWDASTAAFPSAAQAGYTYIVSVAGTVDGVDFAVNDRLLALVDNAATATFANNWLKLDYSDQVLSVGGQTGAITQLPLSMISGAGTAAAAASTDFATAAQGAAADKALKPAGNLSGLASPAAARTNLGLGTLAEFDYSDAGFINRLAGSGRFADVVWSALTVPSTFAPTLSAIFSPINGGTFAQGGKFINNNSNYASGPNAMNQNTIDLLNAMGRARDGYGIEFYIAEMSCGSGTTSIQLADGSQTLYGAFVNGEAALFAQGSYNSFAAWLRAVGGPIGIQTSAYEAAEINGVPIATTQDYVIDVADNWVHFWGYASAARGYDSGHPRLCGLPSQTKINIAIPALFPGIVKTGIHTAPLPSGGVV